MSVDHRVARPRPVRELLLAAALFPASKLGRLAIGADLTAAYANALPRSADAPQLTARGSS